MKALDATRRTAWMLVGGLILLSVHASADDGPVPRVAAETRILVLVNEHREGSALGRLESDDRVAELALRHSERMARGEADFGHDGWGKRSEAVYSLGPALRVAENVSRHQGRELAEVPESAMAAWLESPVHRKNLDGKGYNVTGIGVARGADGVVYVTQIFVEREKAK